MLMKKTYPKTHGGFSYEIMDEETYERFWWGRRPSSKEAFEAWLGDPNKTQHQTMIEHGNRSIGWIIRQLTKAGILRRFKREGYKSKEDKRRARS